MRNILIFELEIESIKGFFSCFTKGHVILLKLFYPNTTALKKKISGKGDFKINGMEN